MNGEFKETRPAAKMAQYLTQIRELGKSMGRPARDVVFPFFQKLEDKEKTREFFESSVDDFVEKVKKRAIDKRKEMGLDKEEEDEKPQLGPGGLDPMEVLESLPESMRKAFESQDTAALHKAVS